MATDAPSKDKRINLRRPDVMEQVKAQVMTHYRSDLVDQLRTKGEVTCPTHKSLSNWQRNSAFATE